MHLDIEKKIRKYARNVMQQLSIDRKHWKIQPKHAKTNKCCEELQTFKDFHMDNWT